MHAVTAEKGGAKRACAAGGTVQGAAFGGAKMQNSEIRPFLANVEIKQSFIDFFEIHEKTSEAFATEILSKLDADGLRVEDCRGQTYDNAAVMAGRRTGVQTRIREKNPRALYVPYDSHSLSLVGVHAAHVDPVMVTFFRTTERIFTFFAS